ncbi:CcdC family protein [Ectobacillus polymachus]|uniref:CcdC family protein n=1 Tax=Ectobacillus polymachus TaxID=1508806 RepID=UPI003A8C35BB
MNMVLITTAFAIFMAIAVTFLRIKAAAKPTSLKKILIPPIAMSSGAIMYLSPQFRLSNAEIIGAIVTGLFFSIFLIKTSKFEIRGQEIYLKRSKAFIFILIGLVVVRTGLKAILSQSISITQSSGMFFLLAFAMIISWRVAMFREYKKLENELKKQEDFFEDAEVKLT